MENNNNLEQSEQALEPKYDMIFDSYESAYEFYNDYARRIGFSIRKECIGYGKDRVETSRFNYVKLYVVDVFSRFYVYEPRDVKEKAVLIDVFSKYGMNPALASNEE